MSNEPTLHRVTATHYQLSLESRGYGNLYKNANGMWFGDVRWIGGDLRAQFTVKQSTRKAIATKITQVLKG
jgi:hypothetical protein